MKVSLSTTVWLIREVLHSCLELKLQVSGPVASAVYSRALDHSYFTSRLKEKG